VEEADARDKRKVMNQTLKEKQAELHFFEVNTEKERKLEKKLMKDIDIETKKIEEMDAIVESLRKLHD
jgi:hypothetical protein